MAFFSDNFRGSSKRVDAVKARPRGKFTGMNLWLANKSEDYLLHSDNAAELIQSMQEKTSLLKDPMSISDGDDEFSEWVKNSSLDANYPGDTSDKYGCNRGANNGGHPGGTDTRYKYGHKNINRENILSIIVKKQAYLHAGTTSKTI